MNPTLNLRASTTSTPPLTLCQLNFNNHGVMRPALTSLRGWTRSNWYVQTESFAYSTVGATSGVPVPSFHGPATLLHCHSFILCLPMHLQWTSISNSGNSSDFLFQFLSTCSSLQSTLRISNLVCFWYLYFPLIRSLCLFAFIILVFQHVL